MERRKEGTPVTGVPAFQQWWSDYFMKSISVKGAVGTLAGGL